MSGQVVELGILATLEPLLGRRVEVDVYGAWLHKIGKATGVIVAAVAAYDRDRAPFVKVYVAGEEDGQTYGRGLTEVRFL